MIRILEKRLQHEDMFTRQIEVEEVGRILQKRLQVGIDIVREKV